MNKFYYTYKITCTEGSLKHYFYLGKHITYNLNDGYKGSGRIIYDYYKKYPEGYIKEILCFYNSKEELNKAEIDLISQHIDNKLCLNIAKGGDGGDTLTNNPNLDNIKRKISEKCKGRKHSEESKHQMSIAKKGKPSPNKGKAMSEEQKLKISNSKKGRTYAWVYKDNIQTAIPREQLNDYLSNGWINGRLKKSA